jgi:phenylpropionate dioxygenase-like ring-hydroxylating dioxygenase large terminal subunit
MAELDHWHPVAKSEDLRRPLAVTLAGREIVVFRSEGGVGALVDRCPHRGMRLSLGHVEGDRLVCPYHAWSWAADGSGRSPGNPKVSGCAERFDAVERLGAVWIKNAGTAAPFPAFDVSGYHEIGRYRHRAKAPLEVVLDNFIEVEHTGNVHLFFGYPTERMAEVESEVTITDATVRVYNRGPQRPLPPLLGKVFRIEAGDAFVDDWTTYFGPVYSVYDHYWIDPRSGERRPDALRIAVFFNPVSPTETDLFTFAYSLQPPWGRYGLNLLMRPLSRRLVDLEIRRDVELVSKLADQSPSLKGNALGRFDKALVAARKRIDRLYRGRDDRIRLAALGSDRGA